MAAISIVGQADLEGAQRLDAEYYQPRFRENREAIARLTVPVETLGSIAPVIRKGIFDIKAASYTDSGVAFVRIGDLRLGVIDKASLVHIPEQLHQKNYKTALVAGDVVLSKTAFSAASLVTLPECNVSQDTIAVKLSPSAGIKPGFLAAFLNGRVGMLLMEQWFQGNVQMHLALPDVRRIPVPVLSDTLQQAVHDRWLAAADLLERGVDAYEEAERIALHGSGLSLQGEPSDSFFRGSSRKAIRHARLDAEHFQPAVERLREAVMKAPNGSAPLLSLAVLSREMVNPRATPDQSFSYVELNSIYSPIGYVDRWKSVQGSNAPGRARMKLRPQVVLLPKVQGSLDRVALVGDELDGGVASTGFWPLVATGIEPEVLLVLLRSRVGIEQMYVEASGTILAAVPESGLRRIVLPRLSEDETRAIVRQVQEAHSARTSGKALLSSAAAAVDTALAAGEEAALAALPG